MRSLGQSSSSRARAKWNWPRRTRANSAPADSDGDAAPAALLKSSTALIAVASFNRSSASVCRIKVRASNERLSISPISVTVVANSEPNNARTATTTFAAASFPENFKNPVAQSTTLTITVTPRNEPRIVMILGEGPSGRMGAKGQIGKPRIPRQGVGEKSRHVRGR
jgi:hypothetical protein